MSFPKTQVSPRNVKVLQHWETMLWNAYKRNDSPMFRMPFRRNVLQNHWISTGFIRVWDMAYPMSPKHSFTNRFLGISGRAQFDLWPIWKAGSRIMSKIQRGGLFWNRNIGHFRQKSLKSKGGLLRGGGYSKVWWCVSVFAEKHGVH